jgi:hypothetical protein
METIKPNDLVTATGGQSADAYEQALAAQRLWQAQHPAAQAQPAAPPAMATCFQPYQAGQQIPDCGTLVHEGLVTPPRSRGWNR